MGRRAPRTAARRFVQLAALAAGSAACAVPSYAKGPVRVLPSRDMQAVYRLSGDAAAAVPGLDGAAVLHLTWDAKGRRLRLQAEGRPEVAVFDLSARRAEIVYSGLHAALVVPMRARDVTALTLSHARFKRQGNDTVLGFPCTVWSVRESRGSGTVCVTADGIPLRGSGTVDGRQGEFVALSLAYAPQPASLFAVPPGYARLDLQQLQRTE